MNMKKNFAESGLDRCWLERVHRNVLGNGSWRNFAFDHGFDHGFAGSVLTDACSQTLPNRATADERRNLVRD